MRLSITCQEAVNFGVAEDLANYFAACYLMPKAWVQKAWTSDIRDVEALAGLFNVSADAMSRRLKFLGFIDEEPGRAVATYFRASSQSAENAA